jgi:putative endonuclease
LVISLSSLLGFAFLIVLCYFCTLQNILDLMAQHNDFGRISEDRAVAYLMARGYTIRDRNWRLGHKELDIVAQKNDTLVIVEVKARKSNRYGDAVDAVTDDKIYKIVQAANAYVRYHRINLNVRFDIIAITGEPGHQTLEHIEDAFYPPLV